jgi:hypothetical protein
MEPEFSQQIANRSTENMCGITYRNMLYSEMLNICPTRREETIWEKLV